MTLKKSSFEATDKQPLEIEVVIDRQDGFKLPLNISLVGLPEEVQVKPAKSEPEGDSAKSVKIIVNSKKALQSKFRVQTKLWDVARDAEFDLPSGKKIKDFWLTVTPATQTSKKKK